MTIRKMSLRTGCALALAATASLFATSRDHLVAAPGFDPLAHLSGRWVGNAIMTPLSGPNAHFKCIVTYLPRRDGEPGLTQNLRCQDDSNFKLHAATDLAVRGETVVGRWRDKINEIEGTVQGDVTAQGFEIELRSQFFSARMAVAGEGCAQTVHVEPARSSMFRVLEASLSKC